MQLVGLMVTRDSAGLVGDALTAALAYCDAVVVLHHAPVVVPYHTPDMATSAALWTAQQAYPERICVTDESDPNYRAGAYRNRLLVAARQMGATHCAIIDDDERPTTNIVARLRGWYADLAPGTGLQLPWLCLVDPDHYRRDCSCYGAPQVFAGWRDAPTVRFAEPADQTHERTPRGLTALRHPLDRREGGLLHLHELDAARWAARRAQFGVAQLYGRDLAPLPAAWVDDDTLRGA